MFDSSSPGGVRAGAGAGSRTLRVTVLGLVVLAGGFPGRGAADSTDLAGRVVDQAGAGVAGAQVWAIGGPWDAPQTVTQATTDDQGRFTLARAWGGGGPASLHYLSLLARGRDGRIGWQATVWRNSADPSDVRIELGPVGAVAGRVRDQNGRPIAGAVDLDKAEGLFEAALAALEKSKDLKLQNTGIFKMVEILATPPHRREAVVYGDYSSAWHPGQQY